MGQTHSIINFMKNTDEILMNTVISTALKAGDILRKGFRQQFEVEQKSAHDLITEYDTTVQQFIVEQLSKAFPGAGFVAEEERFSTKGDPLLVIDPLDGTNNFAMGIPQFCVSIGVYTGERKPKAGVVYNPVLEELYHAQVGKGAYLNGEPIHVSQVPLKDTLVATALPFKFRDKVDWITQLLLRVYPEVMDIRRLGSAALDTCYTAAGIFGLYFEYGINGWDTAAGICLLREAGGVAVDFSGQPYDPFTSKSIVVGPPGHVERVLHLWHESSVKPEG